MEKDVLFLLKADFMDGAEGPFFCPDSLPLEGLLGYYPRLRTELDVKYLDFLRPRKALVQLLGESHQGLPILLLGEGSAADVLAVKVSTVNGHRVVQDPVEIRRYLSAAYRVARPHEPGATCGVA